MARGITTPELKAVRPAGPSKRQGVSHLHIESKARLSGSSRSPVPKHGAYIFEVIKQAQELVQDKLVTINGFLRTMTINLSCKIEPSRAINR